MVRSFFIFVCILATVNVGSSQPVYGDLPPRRESGLFPPSQPLQGDPTFPELGSDESTKPGGDGLFPAILETSDRGPGSWPLVNSADRDDNRAPQYRVWWYPERKVQPNKHLGFVEQLVEVPFPIILDDPNILAGSFRVRNLNFQTNAILPDSNRRFPPNLWDISFGLAYLYKFSDGSTFGLLPRLGSPSDKPFNTFKEYNLSVIAFYRTPAASEGDFWNFSLIYFPNSQIAFPFPGISYEYRPDDDLMIRIGIPFTLMWKFAPGWKIDFDYRPLTQIQSRLSYQVREGFTTYGGFDWDNQGYFLADRAVKRDLFFRQEKRIVLGVRADIAERLTLDISGGYAFDRDFGAGRNPLNYKYDRINVEAGGFLSAWLLIPF